MRVKDADVKAAILDNRCVVSIPESAPDHFAVRSAIRRRFKIGVEETPIRFVPMGESSLHLKVAQTGEVQFFRH